MTIDNTPTDNTDTNTDTSTNISPPGVPRQTYEKALHEKRGAFEKIRGLEAKLSEYEAKESEREAAKAREAEDWGKLEASYQEKLTKAEQERDEALGLHRGELTKRRRRAFAEAMAKHGGVENVGAVEKLLPTLGLEDDAPEEFDEKALKKAVKALERDVPQLFGGTTTTRKPPPGGGRPLDRDSEYWREQGRRDTQGGPLEAYERAKGTK